jgi:hypothetical protein
MSTKLGSIVFITAALSGAAVRATADSGSVTFNGTRFSFTLVRSVGGARASLDGGVATGKGEGYRLLFDPKGHRLFVYAVRAQPLSEGRFRLELSSPTPEALDRLTKGLREFYGQGDLVSQPLAIEYPPPQEVDDDESLMVELMTNAATGERLSDVIRVSAERKATEVDPLGMLDSRLRFSMKKQPAGYRFQQTTGGCTGRYVWFSLPDRGRFVVSLVAVAGYEFVPAEMSDNRVIRFTVGGDTYEWTSAEPIVRVPPLLDRLWVWHDSTYPSTGAFSMGSMDALPERR